MKRLSLFCKWYFPLCFSIIPALTSCTSSTTGGPLPKYKYPKTDAQNRKAIQKGASLIQDGDLVVRTGNDFISYTLRQFSQTDKTYSHCGLVSIEGGKIWVYHAIGGEDNPNATLRKSSFTSFCNPKYNSGFGIFRYNLTAAEKKNLDSLTHKYYNEKVPFDLKFDLQSDSSFYCAEFVYKVLNSATGESYIPVSHLGDFKYVAIDNLYINPHTCAVYHAKFK